MLCSVDLGFISSSWISLILKDMHIREKTDIVHLYTKALAVWLGWDSPPGIVAFCVVYMSQYWSNMTNYTLSHTINEWGRNACTAFVV